MNISGKHFYNTADFTQKEVLYLIYLALKLKKGEVKKSLIGKTLCMLFFNPSLRTRVSFAVAMQKLAGIAIDLPVSQSYPFEWQKGAVMDQETIEHVKDAAYVLSRYCDVLAIRASSLLTSSPNSVDVPSWKELKKDKVIKSFMACTKIPVVNMESNVYHPCQGLGDAITILEKLGGKDTSGVESVKRLNNKKFVLTWVYHPKALPIATPNSQILAACDLGMNVVVAHPLGWELDTQIVKVMTQRAKQSGGSLKFNNSMDKALKGSHVVCAKSWGALKYYGSWAKEKDLKNGLKDWIITKEKMSLTDDAIFMHCLPVRRNVEAEDQVLDSRNSVIYDQAENRIWAQMAMLLKLLNY